jgi:hypothetical protein
LKSCIELSERRKASDRFFCNAINLSESTEEDDGTIIIEENFVDAAVEASSAEVETGIRRQAGEEANKIRVGECPVRVKISADQYFAILLLNDGIYGVIERSWGERNIERAGLVEQVVFLNIDLGGAIADQGAVGSMKVDEKTPLPGVKLIIGELDGEGLFKFTLDKFQGGFRGEIIGA